MKGKLVPVTIVLVILLTLSGGLTAAQGPAPEGTGPQATVSPAFTYQGQLKKDGTLVNATCTMVFTLYDDDAAGSQQGDPITLTVAVADGLFTAVLNSNGEFGMGTTFDGTALWLEVAVQCPGDPGFSTLTPRQALTAAPYALSLRPGAIVEGDTTTTILSVRNEGEGDGVSGRSASTHGRGVYGWATATSGETHGVEGYSASPAGTGVYGLASATSGTTYGVFGQTASADGRGVVGQATATTGNTVGVFGRVDSTDGTGVYGWATATTGNTIGVLGYTSSISGTTFGVYGANYTARGAGVFGRANYTTPLSYDGAGVSGLQYWVPGPNEGYGVYGEAFNLSSAGVFGTNDAGYAVAGRTVGGVAIYGMSQSNIALYGESPTGTPLALNGGGANLIVASQGGIGGENKFVVTSAGDVYADGGYYSPAPGFAEMLPGAAGLEAGDVLVVTADGSLARCDTAYQPTVVGVYAPQAGVVTGRSEDAAGQVPLAVVGVVRVKVSAENGPIVPGDLLVAAATPGHAMHAGANPPLGTVVGKSLGWLDKDTGTLLMLVMLR